jgi:lysyl-tRNA synthetase class 1
MHWSLAIAEDIVKRRKGNKQVVATGITPSGDIHVGNLREIIIGDTVHSALVDMGVDARLIYVGDTFDPLRRRYTFLPTEYETHVGKPLSEIPDPYGCHSSYADHFLQPFLDSLDKMGIAILRRDDLERILKEVSGRQMPGDWSPFSPLCDACGRITSAIVKDYDMEKEEVSYECECGNTGVASFKGGGKLAWRVDWAARWKILGVTIEPFGKDHAAPGGSFDSGKRISTEIYNYEAPYPIPFEHILLKTKEEGGKKAKIASMSSSRGTNIPVHTILETVPPEILKHVIARVKPDKHIAFNPSLPLLNLIDEYEREIGGIGSGVAAKIPFRHLLTLVQVARGDFPKLLEVTKRSGYAVSETEEELEELQKKARYAENWLRVYAPPSLKFELQEELPMQELQSLSSGQKAALSLMAREVEGGTNLSASEWHDKIYELASAANIETKEIFQGIYMALLKKPSGPRAGWLLASLDAEFLSKRFEAAGSEIKS